MYQENLVLDAWRQRAYGFFHFALCQFSVFLFSSSLFLLSVPFFPALFVFPALLFFLFLLYFFALFFALKNSFAIVRKMSGNCLNRSKGVFMNIRTITPASWSPQKTCCLYTEVSRKSVLRRWIRYKAPLFQYFLWRGLGI